MNSSIISLTIQIIVFIISLYTLTLPLDPKYQILNKILTVENVVQAIEIVFYTWLVFSFQNTKTDITWIRYFDWVFTTPAMLFSLISFMTFMNNQQKIVHLEDIYQGNEISILTIFWANFVMLFFGFLAEIYKSHKLLFNLFGFIGFFVSFYSIYTNFVGSNIINIIIFSFTFVLWFLYGIAAMYPYATKNLMYNILDVFSKNVTAFLLVLYIFTLR
jgi:bacteriorhodopsin